MKTNLLTENLKRGLGIVMRGVSAKASLPVLSMVLIKAEKEGLVLQSTDLEISLKVKVRAKIEEKGEVIVPAKIFSELVSTLPAGSVELATEKESLTVVGNKIRANIMGQSSAEFPVLPSASGKGINLDLVEYKEKMDKVAVAAARDDSRPVLSGVLWQFNEKEINLVATDGYRLGLDSLKKVEKFEEQNGKRFVLPVRAVLEMTRIFDQTEGKIGVEFDDEKQQVIFSSTEVELSSRLIAGEFPPYQKVIPSDKKMMITVDREDFMEGVKRAALFARDSANVVKLNITDGVLKIMADNDQTGNTETEVEVLMEGENVKAAFNAKYLLDYLGAINQEKVILETEGELKPAVFKLEGEDFVHIIMPFRVQN